MLVLAALVPMASAEEVGLDEKVQLRPGEILRKDVTTPGQASIAFRGDGSATALDLAIPALNGLNKDLAKKFPGVTLGRTTASFTSAPSIEGKAAGRCNLLSADTASLAGGGLEGLCTGDTIESSSATHAGDGLPSCAGYTTLPTSVPSGAKPVLSVATACGNSTSQIRDGMPISKNEAGVAEAVIDLDLTSLDPFAETSKDLVITALRDFSNIIYQSTSVIKIDELNAKQEQLHATLDRYLEVIADGTDAASIKAGAASTVVGHTADSITVDSQAAGATIKLLGAPVGQTVEWLITVDVSAGSAHALWNAHTGKAKGFATPALATIKVKDLLDLCSGAVPVGVCEGGYITHDVKVEDLNKYFAALSAVPQLATEVEVASASSPVEGASVAASASAVKIHALKGLGATDDKGELDLSGKKQNGGIVLRLASADARIAGDLVLGARRVIERELPVTGGPTWLYLGGSLLLATAAVLLARASRRLARQP